MPPVSKRPVIFATAPLRGPGVDVLRSIGDVIEESWISSTTMTLLNDEQLAAKIAETGASIVICEADQCKGAVLDAGLLAIASTRGDPTNVDVLAATAKGIPVLRAPGRNADAVAEMTIALLTAVNRHVLRADNDVREGNIYLDGTIPYQRFRAWQLAGRTAGLIGLGAVGRATKWRLEGLGMNVIAYDPYAADATHDLDELLAESDVVSMHAAVSPDTMQMMGAKQFAAMNDDAIYINSARAGLHDTDALVEALQTGQIGGAGLDHFDGEMLPEGHPLIAMPNVVLTPHIGGATYDTEANHTTLIANGLVQLLNGEVPSNCVNPEVLAK